MPNPAANPKIKPDSFEGNIMNVLRIAAFSDGELGGNPAGVLIADVLPGF
jgi:hypothetical protein